MVDGDEDGAAVGLAELVAAASCGSGWNGSRVLSAITTVAGVATGALGEADAFGATVAVDEGLATGPVALLSLEPLFFSTRKYSAAMTTTPASTPTMILDRLSSVMSELLAPFWRDMSAPGPISGRWCRSRLLEVVVPAVAVVCTSTRPVKLAVMVTGASAGRRSSRTDELEEPTSCWRRHR